MMFKVFVILPVSSSNIINCNILIQKFVFFKNWIFSKIYFLIFYSMGRAGHVPFFKLFCSVLEQGPSAKSFRSCSSFLSFCSRSVPFWVGEQSSHSFRSWGSYLKNSCIPIVLFLIKKVSIPCSILSNEKFHPRQKFYR